MAEQICRTDIFEGINVDDMVGTTTGSNTGFGNSVLGRLTSGTGNTTVGYTVAASLTSGSNNTAVGSGAGFALTTGSNNTLVGKSAGAAITTTSGNTIVGSGAGSLTTGTDNTIVGYGAAPTLTTGSRNVMVGVSAGSGIITGSDNVFIGNSTSATGDYSNSIALGHNASVTATGQFAIPDTTTSWLTTFTTTGTGVTISIGTDGCVRRDASSARYKSDIAPLDTGRVLKLRPVAFRWRDAPHIVESDRGRQDFGLIAEEVVEVCPDLVAKDAEGQPESVRYDKLCAYLIGELRALEALATS